MDTVYQSMAQYVVVAACGPLLVAAVHVVIPAGAVVEPTYEAARTRCAWRSYWLGVLCAVMHMLPVCSLPSW